MSEFSLGHNRSKRISNLKKSESSQGMKYLTYWVFKEAIRYTDNDQLYDFSRKGSNRGAIEGKIIRNKLVKQLRVHDNEIIIHDNKDWMERKTGSSSKFLNNFWEISRYKLLMGVRGRESLHEWHGSHPKERVVGLFAGYFLKQEDKGMIF